MAQITVTLEMTPENLELLKSLCPATTTITPTTDGKPVKKNKKTTTAADEAPAANANAADADAPETDDTPAKVTLTDVRAVALALSKAGKQDFLKAAFEKFGGKKLSDIKEADYPALLKELNGGAE